MKNALVPAFWLLALLLARDSFAYSCGFVFDSLGPVSTKYEKVIQDSLSPLDGTKGAVIAAQSRKAPNYYYHWVRDAALVMVPIMSRLEKNRGSQDLDRMKDYVDFSIKNQETETLTGLGEPKFEVDGKSFNEQWGRPQNDGPALRSITLVRFANWMLSQKKSSYVTEKLYDSKWPNTNSVIKRDLEYLAHHWKEPSFDIWEEVKGDHFYTRMVQYKALTEGAKFADKLGDHGAATFYSKQADLIRSEMENFWDPVQKIILTTRNRVDGLDYKASGLDSSVVLAVLHGSTKGAPFLIKDQRVLSTVTELEQVFRMRYPINAKFKDAIGIGRYPEDAFFGGNPWILLTHSFAEFHLKLSHELRQDGRIEITSINENFFKRLFLTSPASIKIQAGQTLDAKKDSEEFQLVLKRISERGRAYLDVAASSIDPKTRQSPEQFDKINGRPTGASGLSWNAASFFSALEALWR